MKINKQILKEAIKEALEESVCYGIENSESGYYGQIVAVSLDKEKAVQHMKKLRAEQRKEILSYGGNPDNELGADDSSWQIVEVPLI